MRVSSKPATLPAAAGPRGAAGRCGSPRAAAAPTMRVGGRGGEPAGELAEDVVELVAGGEAGQQGAVLVALRFPVDAAHVGVPVEVAHHAPGLVEDLPPFVDRKS